MKYRKFLKKPIAILALAILLMAGGGTAAFAADTSNVMPPLPGGPYSLTITVQSSNPDGTATAISGAELSLYQVAELTVKHGGAYYKTVADFEDTGIVLEDMTAEESHAAAKKFAEAAESKKLTGISGISNGKGIINFSDLKPGAYFVRLDRYSDSDAGYTAMEPFLVLVPGIEKNSTGNRWITDVHAVPKLMINPEDVRDVEYLVIKQVKGNPIAEETFTFELCAKNIMNPMPVGSTDGVKQISIKGSGEKSFGIWTYTEPGDYQYTVREIAGSNRHYTYDKTVYHMTDHVYYSGSKLRVDHKVTDHNGKNVSSADFLFVNQYTKPGFGPKTGDEIRLMIWLIFVALGMCGIVAAVKRRGCR